MVHIDDRKRIEEFLKEKEIFDKIFKRFENIFYLNKTTNSAVPNSIYVYNNVEFHGTETMQKMAALKIKSLGSSNQLSYNGRRDGNVIFTSELFGNTQTLGNYHSYENILVLCNIFHDLNEFTVEVLNAIMEWLNNNSLIDESVKKDIKPRDVVFLTLGDTTYNLRAVGSASNNRETFVDSVVIKSRDSIIKMRKIWSEQLEKEKARYERLRKSTRAMPEISYTDVVTQKLYLSKDGTHLKYSFCIILIVEEAMNESTDRRIKIDPPIIYEGILTFTLDENDILRTVTFTQRDGVSHTKHLHADPSNVICVGTTRILGKAYNSLSELIDAKEKLIRAMSVINTGSCMGSSDRALYDKLQTELLAIAKPNINDVWET